MRGIIEPKGSDLEAIANNKREAEIHNYYTKIAVCAGPSFELDVDELNHANERLEEMDRVEVIELDQATFKYE